MDDIIVYAKTFSDHLASLEVVFTRLREAGIKLKAPKCSLLQQEVAFLGHLVTRNGVKPLLSKVKAIKEWPIPEECYRCAVICGILFLPQVVRGRTTVRME